MNTCPCEKGNRICIHTSTHLSIHPPTNPSMHPYTHCTTYWLRVQALGDFPGDPVVKNQPSNAKGASLISGWGTKIPYVAGQLNRHITMTETMCIVTKIPHTATKTQGSQKKKVTMIHVLGSGRPEFESCLWPLLCDLSVFPLEKRSRDCCEP